MVNNLEDVERLYHDLNCNCNLCRKGLVMKELNYFTAEDVERKVAEQKVDRLAKHYLEHQPEKFSSYGEALEAVLVRHPKLAAGYFGHRVIATEQAVDGSMENEQ